MKKLLSLALSLVLLVNLLASLPLPAAAEEEPAPPSVTETIPETTEPEIAPLSEYPNTKDDGF